MATRTGLAQYHGQSQGGSELHQLLRSHQHMRKDKGGNSHLGLLSTTGVPEVDTTGYNAAVTGYIWR